jgi:hypothetical protein
MDREAVAGDAVDGERGAIERDAALLGDEYGYFRLDLEG